MRMPFVYLQGDNKNCAGVVSRIARKPLYMLSHSFLLPMP
jgi:hypothetical protein